MKKEITVDHEGSFLMGKKRVKIPNELKLKYAKLCYENKMSKSEAARQLCVSYSDILGWVYRYRENGELAFLSTGNNNVYPTELIVPFGSRIPVHQQDIPYQAGESRNDSKHVQSSQVHRQWSYGRLLGNTQARKIF